MLQNVTKCFIICYKMLQNVTKCFIKCYKMFYKMLQNVKNVFYSISIHLPLILIILAYAMNEIVSERQKRLIKREWKEK